MNIWLRIMASGAMVASAVSTASAHGMVAGAARPTPFHASQPFSASPFHFAFHPFTFRSAFPDARFGAARPEGWSGGAYSADVAAFDDEAGDPDNIDFRVQEPFGPGDLGPQRAPEGPEAEGPWNAHPSPYDDDQQRW